jgi:hypothetical protein
MPLQYTTRSTSRELVNGVLLEIWEQCPFSILRIVLVGNLVNGGVTGNTGVRPLQ